jgi:2-dehydropantoate 2-reductase
VSTESVESLAVHLLSLVPAFQKTLLPAWTLLGFGLILPWLEAILGLLILIGLRTGIALIAGSSLLIVLTFGSTLRQDWESAGLQLIYAFIYAVLSGVFEQKYILSGCSIAIQTRGARMKIAVIGAGGVGGYFGARLAASGCEVTFVARGPHFEAIKAHGLRVHSSRGDLHLPMVSVVERIDQLDLRDLVLVAVKLWDTQSVAAELAPIASQGATILSLQNGVDKDSILRRYVPSKSLLGGCCYISASIAEPGLIRHTGSIQRIVFGEYNGERSSRATNFLEACQQASIDAELTDSIERVIWEKFVFLVGLSGTTTSMRQSIGPILANPQTRAFLLDVMREVVAVGLSRGVNFNEGYAEERLAFCDSLPASMTSSMHHDLDEGRRLELPWLSGTVSRLAHENGVSAPLNRAISDVLALYAEGRI